MIPRPELLEKLLAILRSLPSVGPKMSERIAFHILKMSQEQIDDFVQTLENTYKEVRPCTICGYWDDRTPCRICQDTLRDASTLCVVENSQDLVSLSRLRNFNWSFHVLGGALSPLDGVGPQDLRIRSLLKRLEDGTVHEVILALNPDMEGETTSQYLAKQIQTLTKKKSIIKVTRLAQGMPVGGELEYMDEMTLVRAFEGRRDFSPID